MTVTREIRIIPQTRGYYRHELDSRRGPDDARLRIASLWIARDVATGETPDPGLVWVFRALDRLATVVEIVRREQQTTRAVAHGVVRGARIRIAHRSGPIEGVVGGVDGVWLWMMDGRRDILISDLSKVEILEPAVAS